MSNEKDNIINLDEVQENIPPENAVTDESSKWRNVGKNLWSAVSKFTKKDGNQYSDSLKPENVTLCYCFLAFSFSFQL